MDGEPPPPADESYRWGATAAPPPLPAHATVAPTEGVAGVGSSELLANLFPCVGLLFFLVSLVWACRRFLRARVGNALLLGDALVTRWAATRTPPFQDYSAVSREEHDSLLSQGQSESNQNRDDDDEAATASFAPLRLLGDAVKEKLGAFSASACAGSPLYGDSRHTEEEARGLLHSSSHAEDENVDDEDALFEPPQRPRCAQPQQKSSRHRLGSPQQQRRSPARSSPCRGSPGGRRANSPFDDEDEASQDAISSLMKLRPAARDSLGDEDADDFQGPLMGTERAGLLSR